MSADPKKYSWKNVRNLGFVSFFTDMSSEMIFGILPLFIIDDLGAGKAILGLVEGMGEAVGHSTRTISGSISDQVGKRKSLILLCYGLSTLAKSFFALSASWAHVFGIRVTTCIPSTIFTQEVSSFSFSSDSGLFNMMYVYKIYLNH